MTTGRVPRPSRRRICRAADRDHGMADDGIADAGTTDGGMVTAEAAIALPCVALALLGSLSLAAAGAAKVACTDAAGSAARSLSRGDSVDRARALALAAAPGASVVLRRSDGEVVVEVRRRMQGVGLFRGIGISVTARAVGVPELGALP